jgi:hypothetical protein
MLAARSSTAETEGVPGPEGSGCLYGIVEETVERGDQIFGENPGIHPTAANRERQGQAEGIEIRFDEVAPRLP